MQLWTDYEGVTIDGAFPLRKLLLPEGRSAFFSTVGRKGEPTVLRLIECHFDEEEIIARWRCLEALNHPNFLKFERYGQIELDGGPVVYAVFERVDANLAGVLDQGHLSVKDVAQLASSLVTALDVLHTHGFIHEHVEPRNIFAVSDVVKLRSDCIREAPEGDEGRAAKQREVRDLANVLLQALTQRQSLEGIPDYAVPPPFGQIIRNGLDGTWGLENIRAALEGRFGSTQRTAPKSVDATPATLAVQATSTAVDKEKAPSAAPGPSVQPGAQLPLPPGTENQKKENQKREGEKWEDNKAEIAGAASRPDLLGGKDTWGEERSFSLGSRWISAVGAVALLLLLSTWLIAHVWNAHGHNAAQAGAAVSESAAQSAKHISTGSKPASADLPRVGTPLAGLRANWRVIPFTYSREADAEKKVSSLELSHPDLQPAVFTSSGHAPYLVSIGGVMDRGAAYALVQRARSLGLPHDTYAQNYSH